MQFDVSDNAATLSWLERTYGWECFKLKMLSHNSNLTHLGLLMVTGTYVNGNVHYH